MAMHAEGPATRCNCNWGLIEGKVRCRREEERKKKIEGLRSGRSGSEEEEMRKVDEPIRNLRML